MKSVVGICAGLLLCVTSALAVQQAIRIQRSKPKPGMVRESEMSVQIDAGGNPVSAVTRLSQSVIGDDGNGNFIVEVVTTGTRTVGGQEIKMPEQTRRHVVKPTGELVSSAEESAVGLNNFLNRASTGYAPDKDVKVGETWKREFKRGGEVRATARYTLSGLEKVDGRDCARITMTWTGTGDPGSGSATQWMEIATGITVKSSFSFSGFPAGEGNPKLSGKGSLKLIKATN